MLEFVYAGGELIIHGALLLKNSPPPKLNYLTIQLVNYFTTRSSQRWISSCNSL
jgi:hypothetical protein